MALVLHLNGAVSNKYVLYLSNQVLVRQVVLSEIQMCQVTNLFERRRDFCLAGEVMREHLRRTQIVIGEGQREHLHCSAVLGSKCLEVGW